MLRQSKIKSIFTLEPPMWQNHNGYRIYEADTNLYILFEDDMCLVIDYLFIDKLSIDYRPLLETEHEAYDKTIKEDCFNVRNEIHDGHSNRIVGVEAVALEYDAIESISVRPVTYEYGKWIDNDIEYLPPTDQTFDEIRLHMKNGKTVTVCPDKAEADGYILFWSEDAMESRQI